MHSCSVYFRPTIENTEAISAEIKIKLSGVSLTCPPVCCLATSISGQSPAHVSGAGWGRRLHWRWRMQMKGTQGLGYEVNVLKLEELTTRKSLRSRSPWDVGGYLLTLQSWRSSSSLRSPCWRSLKMEDSQIKQLLMKTRISCYAWKNGSCSVQNGQELESAWEKWGKWRGWVASSWLNFN